LDLAFSPPVCFNRAAKALMFIEKVQNITDHDKVQFFHDKADRHASISGRTSQEAKMILGIQKQFGTSAKETVSSCHSLFGQILANLSHH
jgi:hypothetical protein